MSNIMLLSVANIITLGRIVVIPIISVLMWQMKEQPDPSLRYTLSIWAAAIFVVAAISDMVDGWLARKYGQVSRMGKFFDPMADKLIHMTVLVHLVELDRMAAWIVVLLLFREIFVTGLRAAAAGEGMIIDAAEWGKRKTAFLNVALTALIIYEPFLGIQPSVVGWVIFIIGYFYAIASGVQYSWHFFRFALKR